MHVVVRVQAILGALHAPVVAENPSQSPQSLVRIVAAHEISRGLSGVGIITSAVLGADPSFRNRAKWIRLPFVDAGGAHQTEGSSFRQVIIDLAFIGNPS